MAGRHAIEMFSELLEKPFPVDIQDINTNDHYQPKDDIVDNWTTIVEKDEAGLFVLRFAYQLRTPLNTAESWVKLTSWAIECVVAQGDFVVVDLEKQKDDRVTFILHHLLHPFDKNECEMSSPQADCFDLKTLFTDYALNAPWTGKRLGRLLNNVTKVNAAVEEGKKGKGKKSTATERVPRVPRTVSGGSRPVRSETSRGSRKSKRSHSQMENSGVTEGPEVSSTLSVAPLLKRGQAPDAELSTKIFQEFDDRTKDCWPLGRFYTFDVDIFKCHGAPSVMNVRAEEKDGVTWQMNNIMNNPKGNCQTICVTPKDPVLPVTKENWEEIKKGDFYIIDGQHSVAAAKILLKTDAWKSPLKKDLRYWKSFIVYIDNTNTLTYISGFMNQGNKVRQFEASWAANLVAARSVWVHLDRPQKERENAAVKNPQWKVCFLTYLRTRVRIFYVLAHAIWIRQFLPFNLRTCVRKLS